jgi:hypothetical protein
MSTPHDDDPDIERVITRLLTEGRLQPIPDRRQRKERRHLGYGGRRADDIPRPMPSPPPRDDKPKP